MHNWHGSTYIVLNHKCIKGGRATQVVNYLIYLGDAQLILPGLRENKQSIFIFQMLVTDRR